MEITVTRHAYLSDCTLGYLVVDRLRLATLEEPWRPNPEGPGGMHRIAGGGESCIPDGTYELKPHFSARYPAGVWYLHNPELGVYAPATRPAGQKWGRDAVLIHSGNTTDDTEGCILVGKRQVLMGGRHQVLESRQALELLRDLLGPKSAHTIHLRPTIGTREPLP